MKPVLPAIFCFAVFLGGLPASKGVSKPAAPTEKHKAAQPSASIEQAPPAILSANQDRSLPIDNTPDNVKEERERKLVAYTGWLVIAGVLQFFALIGQTVVFWRTLSTINIQAQLMRHHAESLVKVADAAKNNAEAARLNAQAVINAERAWIIVELHNRAHQGEDERWYDEHDLPLSLSAALAGKYLQYSFVITNKGRTPAQIIRSEMSYSCLAEDVTELPENGANFVEVKEIPVLLVRDATLEGEGEEIDIAEYMKDSWDEIHSLKKTAVFHGSVTYRHMFGPEECKSYYCYAYRASRKVLTSVYRHTQYT